MDNKKINLKQFPILPNKKRFIEDKIIEFVKQDITRKIFKNRQINELKDSNTKFLKLGLNNITSKEDFVELNQSTDYELKFITKMYSDSIEEGELELILDKILSSIKEQNKFSKIVEDKNPMATEVFGELLDKAFLKLPKADLIITNFHDSNKFFWLDKKRFHYTGKEKYTPGTYDGIYIFLSRVVPNGKTIVLNTKEIGEFIVKKDISASLTEITNEERVNLKKTLNLTDEELDNKVRLLVEEVVQFVLNKPESAVLIETSEEN